MKRYEIQIDALDPQFTLTVNEDGIEITNATDGWYQVIEDDDIFINEIEEDNI